jgi:hypothetical protein
MSLFTRFFVRPLDLDIDPDQPFDLGPMFHSGWDRAPESRLHDETTSATTDFEAAVRPGRHAAPEMTFSIFSFVGRTPRHRIDPPLPVILIPKDATAQSPSDTDTHFEPAA